MEEVKEAIATYFSKELNREVTKENVGLTWQLNYYSYDEGVSEVSGAIAKNLKPLKPKKKPKKWNIGNRIDL